MDTPSETSLERMLSWRVVCINMFVLSSLIGFAWAGADKPADGLLLIFQMSLGLLALLTVRVWYQLFLCALEHGGAGYALGHLGLSIALTPCAFLGVFIVPVLVESDVKKGIAEYSRQVPQLSLPQRLERGFTTLIALVLGWPIFHALQGLLGILGWIAMMLLVGRVLRYVLRSRLPTERS